uniref:Nephrocystin 3-like N-terminal domain-containing protein n=1 Tax=Schizophyllum commune (strain H4-8 / FGSC 9210) TaxID=578458 RepID=D8Q5V7_SCHCM
MASIQAGTSRGCRPNTRVQLLAAITDWAFDIKGPRCLILHGAAGKGKSAVANSIARILADMGAVAPFFAFDRTNPTRHAHQLYPTLAEKLARYDQQYLDKLRLLRTEQLETIDIEDQHRYLMLATLRLYQTRVPTIFVVDALDECRNDDDNSIGERATLIRTLRACIWDHALPPSIRFLITTRPDDLDIASLLGEDETIVAGRSIDHEENTESDIRKVVEANLRGTDAFGLEQEWPLSEPLVIQAGSCIFSVAYSPDGKKIVAGGNILRIWDAETGRQDVAMQGHAGWVSSVAFSPDRSRIASGSRDFTVRLWDAKTGQQQGEALRGHTDWVRSVSFSPDGATVVSASDDRTLRLWDAKAGKEIGEAMQGHTRSVNSVVFSCDGARIVSGANDGTVRIWETATRQQLGDSIRHTQVWASHGHTGWIHAVAFSLDNMRVVSGGDDNTVLFWDVASGEQVGDDLRGHADGVSSVAFSPDGKHIASGSYAGTLRVWHVREVEKERDTTIGHTRAVTSVACSPDGKYIVSGSRDQTVRLWNAETGQPVGDPIWDDDHINCVAFSPDSTRIATASDDGTVRVLDVETRLPAGDELRGHDSLVFCVAFSPNGTQFVSGSADDTMRFWDLATGQQIGDALRGHGHGTSSVSFSSDGFSIASGSPNGTIRFWDTRTLRPLQTWQALQGYQHCVWSVAFSPDGVLLVSGSSDKTIRLWDVKTGENVGEPLVGHTEWVRSVSFSPDGRFIVSGSNDGTVRVWDVQTRQQVGVTLQGHDGGVNSVALTSDGARIVSGSDDGTIRVWDFRFFQSLENLLVSTSASMTKTRAQAALWKGLKSPWHGWIVSGEDDDDDDDDSDDNDSSYKQPLLWIPHHLRHYRLIISSHQTQFVPPAPHIRITLNNSFRIDEWPTYTPAPAPEELSRALGMKV